MLNRFSHSPKRNVYPDHGDLHKSGPWSPGARHAAWIQQLPKSKLLSYNLQSAATLGSPFHPSQAGSSGLSVASDISASLQKHKQEPIPYQWPRSGSPAGHWPFTRFPVCASIIFILTEATLALGEIQIYAWTHRYPHMLHSTAKPSAPSCWKGMSLFSPRHQSLLGSEQIPGDLTYESTLSPCQAQRGME